MIYMNKRISMEGQFFSQFGEDKWIVDNLHYPLNGVFVDVGASDGISGNNTYFFEKIGWQGLCIDADPSHYASLLVLHDIQKMNLLDIDVEGSEIDVWNSFSPELYRPEVVIIEYSDSRQCCNKTEIISVITEYPYNLVYTTPANLIFVRRPLGWVHGND